jgi:hypothetical protein
LAALILATEIPFFRAMADSVSPFVTVYFTPEGFLPVVLAVDFEGVDFFLAVLLEAVVFLGVEDVLEGVTFFEPLKA